VAMVDIYAYPLIILCFWLFLQRKFAACLVASSIGLLFKEFFLELILAQLIAHIVENWKCDRKVVFRALLLTFAALMASFVLPRLLMHVSSTFQDIDPLNARWTWIRLLQYPLQLNREINIIFGLVAYWLPTLLLITNVRFQYVWEQLSKYRVLVAAYLFFHLLLSQYGGYNIAIYGTYTVPLQIVALAVILIRGTVRWWEGAMMLLLTSIFNRLWLPIPLPQVSVDTYLDFYGGAGTRNSFMRLGEALLYVLLMWLLRAAASGAARFSSVVKSNAGD
jgi:hypothetical protein